jgi:AcrR family transcriptional regulator
MNATLDQLKTPSPTDPRLRKTRTALNGALLSLLEEKAFDQITIRDIAARADIGYATFFRHFDSREALLHDLVAEQIRHLMGFAVPILRSTGSHAAAMALCTFVDEHRRLWTALLTGGAAGIVREEFVRQAGQVKEPLRGGSWLPSELATIYGVSATVEILAWWLQRGRNVTLQEIAKILSRLVISPFVNASSRPRVRASRKATRVRVRDR